MIKKVLLVCMVMLMCGCSANYELEFKNKKLYEKVTVSSEGNVLSSEFNKYNTYYVPAFVPEGNFDFDNNLDTKLDGINYYEKKSNLNGNNNELIYTYNFHVNNFKKAYLPNYSSQYFSFDLKGDKYILSTGTRFKIFEDFKSLDNFTVHIKSNHKLIETNADEVDGYNYYWYLNRNDQSKNIYLELSKSEKVFNYENSVLKTAVIVLAILLIIGLISLGLYKRARDLNSI